jgi:hypothetical protein
MGDRRKCQTFTASPAEPGGLPVMLEGVVEILPALDLGPNKDMQFRREEIEQVSDPTPDSRYLNLVLFQRVGIDDFGRNTAPTPLSFSVQLRTHRNNRSNAEG